MEAAIALAALVMVVVLCIAAVIAAAVQVRCIDAAREAARLAARGEESRGSAIAKQVAPSGAEVLIHRDGDLVVVTVSVRVPLLPMLNLRANAAAAMEPT